LERSNLRRDGSLVQEGRSAFDKNVGQLLDFFILFTAYIECALPCNNMFTKANEADEDDVQNRESFSLAYDWIKSQQVQTSCSMRVRIRACSDCGLMDFKVSS
jgi:hypothetical protein